MSLYSQVEQWINDPKTLPNGHKLDNFFDWETDILDDIKKKLQSIKNDFSILNEKELFRFYENISDSNKIERGNAIAQKMKEYFFKLNPSICFLAHGSYGASLKCCVECVRKWQDIIEDQPVHFYYKQLYPEIVKSLISLSKAFKTSPSNLVFINNVEFGMNAILNSLITFKNENSVLIGKGDQVGCFQFTYGAVKECLKFYCEKVGAQCEILSIDISSPKETFLKGIDDFLVSKKGKLKLFVFEHITSPTAVVLPIKEIISICQKYNCLVMIDGAHTLGSFNLNLDEISPDFFVSNCHKWFSNYRGAGILYVNSKYKKIIHPSILSWGLNSNFQGEFIWQGTMDYSSWLSSKIAFYFWEILGGLENVIFRNHSLAVLSGKILCELWDTNLLVPFERCSSMITIKVPPCSSDIEKKREKSLHDILLEDYNIEIPVFTFENNQYMRISFHIYNSLDDTFKLGETICEIQMGKSKEYFLEKKQKLTQKTPTTPNKREQTERLKSRLLEKRKSRIITQEEE